MKPTRLSTGQRKRRRLENGSGRPSHDGKRRFKTRAEAEEAVAALSDRVLSTTLSAYKCRFCSKFHIGRDRKAAFQPQWGRSHA